MKKIIFGFFWASMFAVSAVSAQQKIAFVDADRALINSQPAKDKIAELTARLTPEKNKVKNLEDMVRGLQARLQQDAAVMSKSERDKLTNEMKTKAVAYQTLVKKLQNQQRSSEQELMNELAPRFKSAVTQLMAEGDYTILMHLKVALLFDEKDNLTKRVTEIINAGS